VNDATQTLHAFVHGGYFSGRTGS